MFSLVVCLRRQARVIYYKYTIYILSNKIPNVYYAMSFNSPWMDA